MSDFYESRERNETILLAKKILSYHKLFYLDYKENRRGKFLKITEKDGRFRKTVIIPEEAIRALGEIINTIIDEHDPSSETKISKVTVLDTDDRVQPQSEIPHDDI